MGFRLMFALGVHTPLCFAKSLEGVDLIRVGSLFCKLKFTKSVEVIAGEGISWERLDQVGGNLMS